MVFSRGTWLLVDAAEDTAACDKDDDLRHPDKMNGWFPEHDLDQQEVVCG